MQDVVVDVSNNNGAIAWPDARKAGKIAGWAKALDGSTWHDPTFETNVAAMRRAGVYDGAYGFAEPATSDPAAEANALMDAIDKVGGIKTSPMLDMERSLRFKSSKTMTAAQMQAWCRTWGETVAQRWTGHAKPLLYVSTNYLKTFCLHVVADLFELFIADYTNAANPDIGNWPRAWLLWQWTNTGSVPGFSGDVDLDRYNSAAYGAFEHHFKLQVKGAQNMDHIKVFVGPGPKPKEFDAVYTSGRAWIEWEASKLLGATVDNKLKNGTLDINGTEVKCQIVDVDGTPTDYVPWNHLCPGKNIVVKHMKDAEGKERDWFVVPTATATVPPKPSVQGYQELATVLGLVENYALKFDLMCSAAPGAQAEKINYVCDTGAWEIEVGPSDAAKLGLKKGHPITVSGVGGTVTDYDATIDFDFGGLKAENIPCTIGNSDQVPNLFGARYWQDNGYTTLIDWVRHSLSILQGAQVEASNVAWSQDSYKLNELGTWSADVTVGGQPATDGTALEVQVTSDTKYPPVSILTKGGKASIAEVRSTSGTITITAITGDKKQPATATWK